MSAVGIDLAYRFASNNSMVSNNTKMTALMAYDYSSFL
jgi:hypothetical protein